MRCQAVRKRSDSCIGIILVSALVTPGILAQEPPSDLARLAAQKETETQAARNEYTYRQTVLLEELDNHGGRAGEYREVRDVIFSPQHERTERLIARPVNSLKRLSLTEEDFRDIREVQPFVFSSDRLWLYETRFRGEEIVEGTPCWVLQVRPRQILQGMRFFDGLLWINKKDYSIARTEGQAVPQILSTKSENLFPRFTTIRRPIDGAHWFPARTYADDTLYFRTGPIRVRLSIRYTDYKRFGAESTITFEKDK